MILDALEPSDRSLLKGSRKRVRKMKKKIEQESEDNGDYWV